MELSRLFINEQDVYNHVRAHMLRQRKKSKAVYKDTERCAYRGNDGLACAVGACIPDELYDPEIEGVGIAALVYFDSKFNYLKPYADLLSDLQHIHDTVNPAYWKSELNRLARARRLIYE